MAAILSARVGLNAFARVVSAAWTTQTLLPTGPGSITTGWNFEGTPLYSVVNTNDGGATKIYTPQVNDIVTYQTANLPGSATSVQSVKIHTSVYKLDPVPANTQSVIYLNGTQYTSPDQSPAANTAYEDLFYLWTKSPATGLDWTVAEVNAMEIGIKKTNSAGERCSFISAEVVYA